MKLKIDNEAITEDFFSDTQLIGVIAPIRDYQFAWQLNKHLGFTFRLNTDIDKQLHKKSRQYFFSVYQHNENDFVSYYLYHNHCDGEYLLPEFKHMDFLWLIKGDDLETEGERIQQVMSSIKTLPSVQLVAELTNEKIKHKQHLVF